MKAIPLTRLALLAAAILTSGCGGNGGLPLVPIHGRITLDGQPLAGMAVRFVPLPGTPGLGAGATSTELGEYRLIALRAGATSDALGVPAGSYRVVVTQPRTARSMPTADLGEFLPSAAIGLPLARDRTKSAIPSQYAQADTTQLVVEVSTGEVIDLALTARP